MPRFCSISARATTCPCTLALDHFSSERQQPTRALAYKNATSHLRQSGHLSVRHAYAAKGELYSQRRASRLNNNAVALHSSEGCIFPNIFPV